MGILKAGRPTGRTQEHVKNNIGKLETNKRLNVSMTESEYDKLRRFCFDKKISISEFIRKLITTHIQ
jgi:hypothetical protein